MTCDDVLAEVATALLTGVPLDDATEAHAAACDVCADEIGQLRGMRALLDLASEPAPVDATGGDPVALTRLLEAAGARRRRHRLMVVAAVAAVVVLLPLGVWLGVATVSHRSASVQATASIERASVDRATGVSGIVHVQPVAGGSDVVMSVAGVPAGTRCTLTVVTRDGQHVVVTRWRADYAGTAHTGGTVGVSATSIARVELVDSTGALLLPVPLI